MLDEVKRFHRHRRMFVVHDGKVKVANRRDPRTHGEWLAAEGIQLREQTRGYYLGGRIVAYRGEYFAGDEVVIESLRANDYEVLKALSLALDLNETVEVWAGAKPGKPGEIWQAQHFLYTLGEVLEFPYGNDARDS